MLFYLISIINPTSQKLDSETPFFSSMACSLLDTINHSSSLSFQRGCRNVVRVRCLFRIAILVTIYFLDYWTKEHVSFQGVVDLSIELSIRYLTWALFGSIGRAIHRNLCYKRGYTVYVNGTTLQTWPPPTTIQGILPVLSRISAHLFIGHKYGFNSKC
jgi:hypothetical protein